MANSTQYIFLYDISGANKTSPKLAQVIKQANAHIGLVWSPDGGTLYATGGNDDAVYAYTQSGGTWSQAAVIALGHKVAPASPGTASNPAASAGGVGLAVAPLHEREVLRLVHDAVSVSVGLLELAVGQGGRGGLLSQLLVHRRVQHVVARRRR